MGTKTSEEYGAADMIKLRFDKINNNCSYKGADKEG